MAEDAFAGFLNEQVEDFTSILQLWRANQTPTTQALAPATFLQVLAFLPLPDMSCGRCGVGRGSSYRRGPPGVWLTVELPLQFPRVAHPTGTGPWQRLSCGNRLRLPSTFPIKAPLADSVWRSLSLWASSAASVPLTPDLFIARVIYIQ